MGSDHLQRLGTRGHDAAHVGDALLSHALGCTQDKGAIDRDFLDASGGLSGQDGLAIGVIQRRRQSDARHIEVLGNHGWDGAAVVVNGFLATQNGIKRLAFGVGRNFRRDLHGVLWLRIDAHGFMGPNGQRLAQNGVAVCAADGGDDHFSSLCFHDFKRPHQGIPFVVGIDNELNPFLIEAGVPIRKRNARCGVRGFADAD